MQEQERRRRTSLASRLGLAAHTASSSGVASARGPRGGFRDCREAVWSSSEGTGRLGCGEEGGSEP